MPVIFKYLSENKIVFDSLDPAYFALDGIDFCEYLNTYQNKQVKLRMAEFKVLFKLKRMASSANYLEHDAPLPPSTHPSPCSINCLDKIAFLFNLSKSKFHHDIEMKVKLISIRSILGCHNYCLGDWFGETGNKVHVINKLRAWALCEYFNFYFVT